MSIFFTPITEPVQAQAQMPHATMAGPRGAPRTPGESTCKASSTELGTPAEIGGGPQSMTTTRSLPGESAKPKSGLVTEILD